MFGTPSDLAIYMGDPALDAQRAAAALEHASALIRGYTGQEIAQATTTDLEFRLGCGPLRLPERPVTAVTAVKVRSAPGATPIALVAGRWQWSSDGRVDLDWPGGWESTAVSPWPATVLVTYTHGYAVVPADIARVAVQVAARILEGGGDVAAESLGAYSVTYRPTGSTVTAAERDILGRYRVGAGGTLCVTS